MNEIKEIVVGNVKEVMRAVKTGVNDMYMVRIDALCVREGFNAAREVDPDWKMAVREYADSMKANGYFRHKPMKVAASADGKLYISDGHTRYAAVLLANSEGAGIESVPVVNESKGTTEDDRIFGLILDNNGRKLTPLGEAMVIKQLFGRGIEEKEIARRLGYSITKINNALELVASPPEMRRMVSDGEVSATTAMKVLREKGAGAVDVLKAAKETAVAAGKTKVTEKHIETASAAQKAKRVHADTLRLDAMIENEWEISKDGDDKYAVSDKDGNRLYQASDFRAALDAAIDSMNQLA